MVGAFSLFRYHSEFFNVRWLLSQRKEEYTHLQTYVVNLCILSQNLCRSTRLHPVMIVWNTNWNHFTSPCFRYIGAFFLRLSSLFTVWDSVLYENIEDRLHGAGGGRKKYLVVYILRLFLRLVKSNRREESWGQKS